MIAQELGRRLKNERKAKGFTQKVMAEKMGMVLQQYQTYESGRYQLDYEKLKQVWIYPLTIYLELHNIKCKANKIHFDI